jgi:hypothetical protein
VWVAGRDAHGVFARPGWEVQGVGRFDWAEREPPIVVPPALEFGDALRLFTLTRKGELGVVDFAAPITTVEEASGPDDWDDEVLVPGPVHHSPLGGLGEAVLGARAGRVAQDSLVVAVARGAILHARIAGDSLLSRGRIDLDVRVLSADPALHTSFDGAGVVAVVIAREREDRPDALDVGIARVQLGEPPEVEFRWLGVLEQVPVAVAISFAPTDEGEPTPICALLDSDRTLHLGDWNGGFRQAAAPKTLCSPLTVTALFGDVHVAIATLEGPRLWRA